MIIQCKFTYNLYKENQKMRAAKEKLSGWK